jgi:hypothetical protein
MNPIRNAVCVFLFLTSGSGLARPEGARQEIELCDFQVPPAIARANASFTVVYAIKVGDDGHAASVEKVKNDFLPSRPFTACLGKWILPTHNRKVVVTLAWQHGVGWTEVTVSGPGIDTRIRISRGACKQYGVPGT